VLSENASSKTGLYYYRARYYDSNVGRFLSEDPFGLSAGSTAYSFVENSPEDNWDPSGLAPAKKKCPDPCPVIVPLDSNLRDVIGTMLGEITGNSRLGSNQYADDQQGRQEVGNPQGDTITNDVEVGNPQGDTITNDVLDQEAFLIASTIVNRANANHTPWQTEVQKPSQYTAFRDRGTRLSNAMRSPKGSNQCTDLQRVIDALTKAFHSPEPGLQDYKAVLQTRNHHTFIRAREGATRIAGTDFQY